MDHVYSNKAEPSVELNPAELPGATREEQAGGHKGEGRFFFFSCIFFSVGIIMCVLMMQGDAEEGETVKLSTCQNKGL